MRQDRYFSQQRGTQGLTGEECADARKTQWPGVVRGRFDAREGAFTRLDAVVSHVVFGGRPRCEQCSAHLGQGHHSRLLGEGPRLFGDGDHHDVASREEVLSILTGLARDGTVSAAIALERALRDHDDDTEQ